MGYIGIMEKKMGTTIVYWGHIGIMERKTETTLVHWGPEYLHGNPFWCQVRVAESLRPQVLGA